MQRPIVVMGVTGCGKSTVAAQLAGRLGVPFCEGDDLHPAKNIAKMHAGQPLDDRDRAPWLARINAWMRDHATGGVVSCSALRHAYRDRLRAGMSPSPAFVLLDPAREVLEQRLAARHGHFMPASLLDSQLAALELPTADEHVLQISDDEPPEAIVDQVISWLSSEGYRART